MKNDQMTDIERKKLTEYILRYLQKLPWLKNCNLPIIAIGGSART